MRYTVILVIIQLVLISVVSSLYLLNSVLPSPSAPTSLNFNKNDGNLQVKGDNINNAVGFTFTYSNDVLFS